MAYQLPQRTLGRTGLRVSALGFGGAVIGDLYSNIDESTAQETIRTSLDSGVNLLDTSPLYGHGLSEHRIGAALRLVPGPDVIISTKIGRITDPFSPRNNAKTGYFGGAPHAVAFDYSGDGVMRSLEQSLLRLGRDHVEMVLVHDLEPGAHGDNYETAFKEAIDGAVPALTRLRDQGVIKGYGIGVNDTDAAERFVRNSDPDAVLLAGRYSLLEQPARKSFLPLAEERNIGVILGGVFNSGVLATGPVPGARYNYAEAPPEILDRVEKIEAVCQRHNVPLRTAALKFVFGHPAVGSVVLGAAKPSEVTSQFDDFNQVVPAELWAELQSEELIAPGVPVPQSG
ncbi:MAG: aldo/keto reductase [Verrucomicrobiales bacterium]|nr:aldo/keto reductase [Verrucomicrobiales bacterium]